MKLLGLIFFTLHVLDCQGKKVENTAIVDVKKENTFVISRTIVCKRIGGKLVSRKTLDKYLPCIKQTLAPLKQYWIGKDNDCNKTELYNKYCTFQLTQNREHKFEAESGRKQHSSLCEVDLSTYKNKSLCPFEKSKKRPMATPSMSIGDVLTTAYQTGSIPHASNGTITTMSMELSYDDKRMENIAIVDVKEKYSFKKSEAECENLGGSLVRRMTLQKHRSCIKESLDPLKRYWIGKDKDYRENGLDLFTFLLKEGEPYFKTERSYKPYFSLCEIDLSRYKDKRRLCPSEKTTKGHRATPSMSDGGVMTTADKTESITDASNTGRTTTIEISREQSYDDGSSVEVIIPVVCFLLVAFVVVLTVFVKKRRKRKAIKSKNVTHDPNTLKPTEMAPVHESDSEHNHMLDENPYAEIKESMTGINQASVPNTIKSDETDSNSLKPNEMVPVPVSDSSLYHILEESPYSEIKGSGAENCRNHQASECQESPTRDNEDETYDHLERERSESRHGSEVDVAHPEIDNASEALLEDSCEVREEKDYDHLELKEQSSNIEVFSEYSMADDATRINKDETYDHLERNRSESRHGSEVDVAHPEIDNASESLLEDSCEVHIEKDYDHLELKGQSSNMQVLSEYSMTDDAEYSDLSERKTLEIPYSDYAHLNLK